jgi:hypothetical protein
MSRMLVLRAAVITFLLSCFASGAQAITIKVEDITLPSNGNIIQNVLPGFGSSGPVTLDWDPFNSTSTALRNWNSGGYSNRDAAWSGLVVLVVAARSI